MRSASAALFARREIAFPPLASQDKDLSVPRLIWIPYSIRTAVHSNGLRWFENKDPQTLRIFISNGVRSSTSAFSVAIVDHPVIACGSIVVDTCDPTTMSTPLSTMHNQARKRVGFKADADGLPDDGDRILDEQGNSTRGIPSSLTAS